MRAKGWIEIPDDNDGRAHPFQLTTSGKSLLRRASPAWKDAQAKSAAILGDTGVELLQGLSKEMAAGR